MRAKETRGEITGFVHRWLRFEQTTGTVTPDVGHGFERSKDGDSTSGVGRVDLRPRAFERDRSTVASVVLMAIARFAKAGQLFRQFPDNSFTKVRTV